MNYIKKFEEFNYGDNPAPATPKPATKPGTQPTRRERPSRPSPIRRDKPAIDPAPKAKLPKVSTIEAVIKKYTDLTNQKYTIK